MSVAIEITSVCVVLKLRNGHCLQDMDRWDILTSSGYHGQYGPHECYIDVLTLQWPYITRHT